MGTCKSQKVLQYLETIHDLDAISVWPMDEHLTACKCCTGWP